MAGFKQSTHSSNSASHYAKVTETIKIKKTAFSVEEPIISIPIKGHVASFQNDVHVLCHVCLVEMLQTFRVVLKLLTLCIIVKYNLKTPTFHTVCIKSWCF
jgi:hypothetical protein